MSLNIPGLDECRADVVNKMTASVHNIVYGGALDRELYRVIETNRKTVTIKLSITIELPDNLPEQPIED